MWTGRKAGRSLPSAGTFGAMDNSVALVTGANKGIGQEIAHQLAAAGLTVYVGSRDAARGKRAAGEIGSDARLLVLDVTDAASIAEAAGQVGALDILINNAGISGDDKTPGPGGPGTFRRIYDLIWLKLVRTSAAAGNGLRGAWRSTLPVGITPTSA